MLPRAVRPLRSSKLRQKCEDAGGITARGGGLPRGQADFRCAKGEHKRVTLSIIKSTSRRVSRKYSAIAVPRKGRITDQGRLVAGGDDHDRAARPSGPSPFQELADFATSFPDQDDDVDVGRAVFAICPSSVLFPHRCPRRFPVAAPCRT